jgi:hypothetical protein
MLFPNKIGEVISTEYGFIRVYSVGTQDTQY